MIRRIGEDGERRGGGRRKECMEGGKYDKMMECAILSVWEQAGEIGRNAAEYCATEGCQ